jgi:hypothetical protein
MKTLPILTINPAEAIFAPFHDPEIVGSLDMAFTGIAAKGCELLHRWDNTTLVWGRSEIGEVAAEFVLRGKIRREHYDQLIFCLSFVPDVEGCVKALVDGALQLVVDWTPGSQKRMEWHAPMPDGEITEIRLFFRRPKSAGAGLIGLFWFGLASRDLVPIVTRAIPPYSESWPDLIDLPETWPEESPFLRGLLFDSDSLPALRAKMERAPWKKAFEVIEQVAASHLAEQPECWLGDFIPWDDPRYVRGREQDAPTTFVRALLCGFVGLIKRDLRLARIALRHLMTLVHTTSWCTSAVHRLQGSNWSQRCFEQELVSTTVALLTDWYSWALTPRARSLIAQSLWDKGLAVIERDMMKFAYLHENNQGPFFCRGRILGGLILESCWPHVGDYVERSHALMQKGLNNYLQEDGGVDEGVGYFCMTFEATLIAMFAYAKARGRKIHDVLPPKLLRAQEYVACLSAVEPGYVLLDGDIGDDRSTSDALSMLAGLLPDQIYGSIAESSLPADPSEYQARRRHINLGLFALTLGPEKLPVPKTIVPEFAALPQTGHLTSFRKRNGHSVRLHFAGSKANASHTHFDKGNITLEIDGQFFLVDRGTRPYSDSRAFYLKDSEKHNVITPVGPDDLFFCQALVTEATIPQGRGDANTLEATLNLNNVWRDAMHSCRRTLSSDTPFRFQIEDAGALKAEARIAFHLQSLFPFSIAGKAVSLSHEGATLEIGGEWIEKVSQYEDGVDCRPRPVWHLVLLSKPVLDFHLITNFQIRFEETDQT